VLGRRFGADSRPLYGISFANLPFATPALCSSNDGGGDLGQIASSEIRRRISLLKLRLDDRLAVRAQFI